MLQDLWDTRAARVENKAEMVAKAATATVRVKGARAETVTATVGSTRTHTKMILTNMSTGTLR